jgi:hypothetical protein
MVYILNLFYNYVYIKLDSSILNSTLLSRVGDICHGEGRRGGVFTRGFL